MSELTEIDPESKDPENYITFRDLVYLGWQHFVCLPNKIALWWLGRQFRKDPSYRDSWVANIAMPIYDGTRMKCICSFNEGHEEWCPIVKANDIRAFECGEMSHAHANYIAENLMKHLFKA